MTDARVKDWRIEQLGDLTGRRYLITGANSGVGFAAAQHLRRANADVLLACRSTTKGEQAIAALRQVPGDGDLHLIELDLASTDSIRRAGDSVHAATDGLDGVVNNAGIMTPPQQQTADGFELQFGTNHLGHFLLNHLVFDLVSARNGRVVPVSSIAHRQSPGINFDDPMFSRNYSASKAYAQSKLANLLYGLELDRRLRAAGSEVSVVCCHPGYTATNLQTTGPTGIMRVVFQVANVLAMRPEQGSLSEVLAVAGDEARPGAYYGPTGFGEIRGPVGECTPTDPARDEAAAARLWALSEELLGITWTVTEPA
ncbi:MAG: SDR family NAD(P)-dependent oxidoreductase [Actinomycetales bacterium]|nr:SDR family NAD(P)-dependent oxidoreductase [Actinomycetales bacterium]